MRNTKDKLLAAGAELFLLYSYQGTGINDILKACGVPKGSFYNYFPSKEEFALQVVDYHLEKWKEFAHDNLCNENLPPLKRMAAYLDAIIQGLDIGNYTMGCPFGTMAQEVAYLSPKLRTALTRAFQIQTVQLVACIEAGQKQGEINPGLNPWETAGVILSAVQGAQILAKTYLSNEPLVQIHRMMIDAILPAHPVPKPLPPVLRTD